MTQTNSPASSRQLWALYCITKTDYRNKNLTYEEASKLIQELGNKDYKKAVKKPAKKSLRDELLEHITKDFDRISGEAVQSLKHMSIVEDDPMFTPEDKRKQYAFVGVGCGITYLKYDGRSKLMKEIDTLAKEIKRTEAEKMFINRFTAKEQAYYRAIGNPLEALWWQDQGMQNAYWYSIVRFAEAKGVKNVWVYSILD